MNEQWETQLQQRLEQRLSGLHQDLERVWWKDGAQVRQRGVQLTMQRMWLIVLLVPVLAILLCVGVGLYQMNVSNVPPPEPLPTAEETTFEPSPSATASPSPTPGVSEGPRGLDAVPADAILTPNDVGAGFTVDREASQGPNAIRLALNACVTTAETTVPFRLGSRGRTLSGPGAASIEEEVSSYQVGWGTAVMSEWRQRIASCPTSKTATTANYLSTVDVPGLGQEAFLVRREFVGAGSAGYVAWSAFVRQGDFVAFVGENQGEAFVREVAAKAAGRLCAAVC
jgi:hypothetical protein